MTSEASGAPASGVQRPESARRARWRRVRPPDPELLIALWKGVWSTAFTVVTLSAALFACANSTIAPKHQEGVVADGPR